MFSIVNFGINIHYFENNNIWEKKIFFLAVPPSYWWTEADFSMIGNYFVINFYFPLTN